MTYIVDAPRAEIVLGKIWERYVAGLYPYTKAQTMLPQSYVPVSLPRGGEEEAWYWMVVCLWMRGGVSSTKAAKQLRNLYDYLEPRRCRNPFVVGDAARMRPKRIVQLLEVVNLGMHQAAPAWIENAQRLEANWGGSVLSLYEGVRDFAGASQRIHVAEDGGGFVGFRSKMVSMLSYFLVEAKLIEPFAFPPPVDFHLQRIAVATGIVSRSDGSMIIAYADREFEELQSILRDLYLDYELRHGIDGNRFTDALWVLSRTLCKRNPGNKTHQASEYKGRSTLLSTVKPDWANSTTVRAYERSCGSCPVESLCFWNIPAGPRYRQGKLLISGPRTSPEIQPLFSAYLLGE